MLKNYFFVHFETEKLKKAAFGILHASLKFGKEKIFVLFLLWAYEGFRWQKTKHLIVVIILMFFLV